MSQKINIEELKRENGFKVPANYFDSFENTIQERIHAKEDKSILFRFRYPSIAFAASFIAFSIWLTSKNDIVPTAVAPASIDYVSYVNENIDEFDDEIIYETYTPTASIEVSEIEQKKIEKTEALDEYLLDEGVDEQMLMDEL
jgi:hypothetical protein